MIRPVPLLLVLAAAPAARADVRLPAVFGDHMVLQEGRRVPFWGTAAPGEAVSVTAAGQTAQAIADGQGRWRVELGPLTRRDPFEVVVRGRNTVTFRNVVTGEVWIASGQSNMEWPLTAARRPAAEIEQAAHPRLRLFRVERPGTFATVPGDVVGRWEVSTPESAAVFSAAGYFFGRALLEALDRPIGIVQSAWGGTPAEAWTSRAALAAHPQLRYLVEPPPGAPADLAAAARAHEEAVARHARETTRPDPGNAGEGRGFASAGLDDADWEMMILPAFWENEGLPELDGAVWFRKQVTIPAAWVGQPLTLHLGRISDCDTSYVNGVEVGKTCDGSWMRDLRARRYPVPARAVTGRRVVIAVRVFDERGPGGFNGAREDMRLVRGESFDGPGLPLHGEWRYQVETRLPPAPRTAPPARPPGVPHQNSPAALHERMLAPLVPFAIRGAIWYQGESNTRRAFQYRTLFPLMIEDWRRAFGQGDFPFLFVQLASYHPRWPGPGQRSEDEWAELREAQLLTLRVPQTGMAVTIDIGERDDIHPRNKQEVGRRLALVARARVYGQDVPYSGPIYAGHTVEGGRLRLRFEHAAGLTAPGGAPLVGFEVAGRDRRYVAAEARIEGDAVVVSAPTVAAPVAARYAWSDAPLGNLYNAAGLPASPFRTDRWPALTLGRR